MDLIDWLRHKTTMRRAAFGEPGLAGCRYDEAANEIERLRSALKPFAECAEAWDHDTADLNVQLLAYDDNKPAPALSVADFRRARELLSTVEQSLPPDEDDGDRVNRDSGDDKPTADK